MAKEGNEKVKKGEPKEQEEPKQEERKVPATFKTHSLTVLGKRIMV